MSESTALSEAANNSASSESAGTFLRSRCSRSVALTEEQEHNRKQELQIFKSSELIIYYARSKLCTLTGAANSTQFIQAVPTTFTGMVRKIVWITACT